jgi:hypothetical protein
MTDGLSWSPGWFPDPTGRHDHRWWDGAAWTAHVADGGVAALDAIEAPGLAAPPGSPGIGRNQPRPGGAPAGNDPVAVTALVIGLIALPTTLIPGLGLVLAAAAVVLGLVARSRIRTSRRDGDGVAIAGLVIGLVALMIALVVTVVSAILLTESGGELAGALREYVACLETRTESECRIALERSLVRIVG